jgi:ribosomal protein L17
VGALYDRKERHKHARKLENNFLHELSTHRDKLVKETNAELSLFDRLMRWVVVKYYNVEPFNIKMAKIEAINDLIDDVKVRYAYQPGGITEIIKNHRKSGSLLDYAFTIFNSRTSMILERAIRRETKDLLLKADPRLKL